MTRISAKNFEGIQAALSNKGPDVPKWVRELRSPAFENVQKHGFPSLRDEEWRYTNVKPIAEETFDFVTECAVAAADVKPADIAPYIDGAGNETTLVFVDGILSVGLSRMDALPDGFGVYDLKEAFAKYGEELNQLLAMSQFRSSNSFYELNKAFLGFGSYLRVAEHADVGTVHLLYVSTDRKAPHAMFPRCLVNVARSAQLSLVETHLGLGAGASRYFKNTATTIYAQEQAKLSHMKIQAEGQASFHVSHTDIVLEKDARAFSFCFDYGARLSRNNLEVLIRGEGADITINGLYLTRDGQHVDNHTTVSHAVGHATSSQLYKGLLTGKSRAVFNGKVIVKKNAAQTNAFQLNKNLLLDERAEVNTKPELQIDNNDVKCSHGAAIGQLNPEELFYLLSRGIPKAQASELLCQGYAADVVNTIEDRAAKDKLRSWLKRYFDEACLDV